MYGDENSALRPAILIKPEKGVCLIFPSYLPHLVEANKDTTRYIVAGNLKIN